MKPRELISESITSTLKYPSRQGVLKAREKAVKGAKHGNGTESESPLPLPPNKFKRG